MDTENSMQESAQEVEELLATAREAYEADNSTTVTESCRAVLELDPDNAEAWVLLAKFGGWDSRQYLLDLDFAIESANHALDLLPESARIDTASDIYNARKRQIAHQLEAEMMMPSYTGAKQLHATMQDWLRLLDELPDLNADLIEGEITVCENLCLRSKLGIMPGDRLVYTAYSSLNGKETYGEMFRRKLESRLSGTREEQKQRVEAAMKLVEETRAALDARAESGEVNSDEEKSLLEDELAALQAQRETLVGFSDRAQYEQQLRELERQLAALKPMKFLKRQELGRRIELVKQHIAEVDENIVATTRPLDELIERIERRMAEL